MTIDMLSVETKDDSFAGVSSCCLHNKGCLINTNIFRHTEYGKWSSFLHKEPERIKTILLILFCEQG
jgi:hypothetical protein